MKVLIVGLGSMGVRHLSNLRSLEPSAYIIVCHSHSRKHAGVESSLVNKVVYDLDEALGALPEAAIISNPASLHTEVALTLAQHGVHLLVEKPLSNKLNGLAELIEICHQKARVLLVGYNLRFYKPLQALRQVLLEDQIGRVLTIRAEVGQYLPDWRPRSDYRQQVSARSDLGGGAILELSHELDYVRWMVGEVKSVSAQIAHLSDLAIDVEDTAEIILQFRNGAIGSVHLNMTQRSAMRRCHIVGTLGTLEWDGFTHQVRMFSSKAKNWSDLFPAQTIDRNEMYVAELRHFLDCVRSGTQPLVDGQEGKRVLEIALAAKQSSREGCVVEV